MISCSGFFEQEQSVKTSEPIKIPCKMCLVLSMVLLTFRIPVVFIISAALFGMMFDMTKYNLPSSIRQAFSLANSLPGHGREDAAMPPR